MLNDLLHYQKTQDNILFLDLFIKYKTIFFGWYKMQRKSIFAV